MISGNMKFVKKIYHLQLLSFATCLIFALASCIDDKIILDEQNPDSPNLSDELAISFDISLDINPSSRAGEQDAIGSKNWTVEKVSANPDAELYENYIDTQDKFRVFFFTEDGDFLFGAIDRTISQGGSVGVNNQTYTVRVPINVLVDRQGNEYPVEDIKNYLRTNSFKVAVLVNWPNAGEKVNPGDYDDGDNTGSFGDNPSSTLKGHPLWGLKNSVLYEGEDKDLKNINDLHHLFDESNVYASTVSTSNRASNLECYQPFMAQNEEGKWTMGEPTDWVKMRDIDEGWNADKDWTDSNGKTYAGYSRKYLDSFDSKETANIWIRANWNPNKELNEAKGIYRHYQHLWYLWNFDASYKYGLYKNNSGSYQSYASAYQGNFGWNNGFTQGVANTWGAEWYDRNGEQIYNWLKGTSSTNTLSNITIYSGTGQNDSFFTFNPFINGEECYLVDNTNAVNNNQTYYGIRLPSRGNTMAGNHTPGVFVFQARTSGTLRVKWGNGHNSASEAKLTIQKGTEWQRTYTVSTGNRYKLFDLGGTSDPSVTFYDIETDARNTPVYIYCSQGDAIIYSIEYIRGKYLYETDREGVIPDESQGIPMYGVQNFEALNDWMEGSTANLTQLQNLEVKLLRALAKVEVYIPKSFGRPRHMYMRNMNRTARCEPMNVENPIDWTEETGSGHPANCEFFNIMKHGPTFDSNKMGVNASAYRDWLSWFYGSWASATWGDNKSWIFEGVTLPEAGEKGYPQIFNPYINRSDFCHFIFMGEDPNNSANYKYVLYMPEKYIDDPVNPGNFASNPAVPHIEYRFDPATSVNDKENTWTHSEFNLDDDRCFRIYFTNYNGNEEYGEKNPKIGDVSGSSYYTYEADRENLKYHWPILRNHTYQFYVNSVGPERATIEVKISDWNHEKVVTIW